MAVSRTQIKDFSLTFEGRGAAYLMGEIGIRYYLPGESMIITKDNVHSEYISKWMQIEMEKEGEIYFATVDNIAGAELRLDRHFQEIDAMRSLFASEADLSRSDAECMYAFMGAIHTEYRRFGHGFTDRVYMQSSDDAKKREALEYLSKRKNPIREQYDTVFFTTDSALSLFLRKIGAQFGIDPAELTWCMEDEILGLYEGADLPKEQITKRKIADVFYRPTADGRYQQLEGEEAVEFIDAFMGGQSRPNGDIIRGTVANGASQPVRGRVRIISSQFDNYAAVEKQMEDMAQGDILVATVTSPDLMVACRKAAAIVTDVGGLLSHGAIISRELGIPGIVDTQFASKVLKDGDMVEVDAETGVVRKI